MVSEKLDQKLEERAYIKFEFPDETVRILPFYENPTIRESKKANYVSYNPLSRSTSLFAYTGAEARNIKLSFSITLPHIMAAASYNYSTTLYKGSNSKQEEQQKFFEKLTVKDDGGSISLQEVVGGGSFEYHFSKYRDFVYEQLGIGKEDNLKPITTPNPILVPTQVAANQALTLAQAQNTLDILGDNTNLIAQSVTKDYKVLARAVNIIMFWLNLIRSSVLNNSKNPALGPPILRLYKGITYQAVPCVCHGYDFDYDDVAGFESISLLPRRINVTLNLQEFRAGDFKDYQPNHMIKRDNAVGWEAVIGKPHSVDPLDTTNTYVS